MMENLGTNFFLTNHCLKATTLNKVNITALKLNKTTLKPIIMFKHTYMLSFFFAFPVFYFNFAFMSGFRLQSGFKFVKLQS